MVSITVSKTAGPGSSPGTPAIKNSRRNKVAEAIDTVEKKNQEKLEGSANLFAKHVKN